MSLKQTEFVCVDVETTGVDPATDRVIEVAAWVCLGDGTLVGDSFVTFVAPGCPIPPESSAVHHIIDEDLVDAPEPVEVMGKLLGYMGHRPWFAHNIGFDSSFLAAECRRVKLERERTPGFCTLRLARHLLRDAPNHQLQTLKYLLKLTRTEPHRAEGDVRICCELFSVLVELYLQAGHEDSVEGIVEFSKRPIPVEEMPRGKHRGMAIREIPVDYLRWVKGSEAFQEDSDLRYALEQEFERRRSGNKEDTGIRATNT